MRAFDIEKYLLAYFRTRDKRLDMADDTAESEQWLWSKSIGTSQVFPFVMRLKRVRVRCVVVSGSDTGQRRHARGSSATIKGLHV